LKKEGYHKELKLLFTIENNGIMFQDDVFYSNEEISILKNNPDFDYDIIHAAKKIFNAEVVNNPLLVVKVSSFN